MAAAVALSDMETELGTSTEAQTVLVFGQRRGWERVKGDSSVRSSFSFFYFSFFLVLAGHPRVLLTTCMFKCCLLCLPFAVSNGCRWLFGLRLSCQVLLLLLLQLLYFPAICYMCSSPSVGKKWREGGEGFYVTGKSQGKNLTCDFVL